MLHYYRGAVLYLHTSMAWPLLDRFKNGLITAPCMGRRDEESRRRLRNIDTSNGCMETGQ